MSKQTPHQTKATTSHDAIKNGPKNDAADRECEKPVVSRESI
jgi:hypothetical protein